MAKIVELSLMTIDAGISDRQWLAMFSPVLQPHRGSEAGTDQPVVEEQGN
jgi:hypothetical protein